VSATEKKMRIAYGRRFGATPEARERMEQENAKLIWRGRCRRCGEMLKGTPAQLKEHTCEARS